MPVSVMVKKGITAVVATVMLLMMTVAAAGMAYIWITDMQKEIQEGTSAQIQQQQIQSHAIVSIDSMWNASGNISFVLRNVGSHSFSDPAAFSVYYDGIPVEKKDVGFSPSTALSPGSTTLVYINRSFATPSSPKTIRIITDVGTDVSYKCRISSASMNYC